MQSSDSSANGGRSLFRFLIFPKKQLKYAFFHFLTVSTSVLAVNIFSYFKFTTLLNSSPNNISHYLLSEYTYYISIVSLITLFLMGSASFLLVIIFLHRFVGPIKPMLRHLDCILKGDYSHRTHLRTDDEVNELAIKLNAVSEHLSKLEADRNKAG